MRARNIKPGFFKNEQLPDCDPLARLLFIGLWCMADRRGRMEDRPKKIKIEILPCDNCDVEALLNQLQRCGFICRYEVNGRRYIQVVNFEKHQHPHHKEPDSALPAPEADAMLAPCMKAKPRAGPVQASEPPAPTPPDSLIPDSLIAESPEGDDARVHERKAPKRSAKDSNRFRMPYDSLPSEWAQWTSSEMGWGKQVIHDVWACFHDYWQGRTGRSAEKSDWQATWRVWCRKQHFSYQGGRHATTGKHTSQGARPSKSERFKQALIDSTCEELGIEGRPGGQESVG